MTEPKITSMPLQKFKDELSMMATGMTKDQAHQQLICINCKLPAGPRCHTDAGRREYHISGMCEECFDKLFAEEDDIA